MHISMMKMNHTVSSCVLVYGYYKHMRLTHNAILQERFL